MSDLDTLSKIIPPDQALANKALAISMQQVKNIFGTTTPELAPTVAALETNKGLDLIQNLDTPIPTSVQDFYKQNLATGTGPGGSLVITDVIGTAAGTTHNTQLPIATDILSTLSNIGALNSLTANGGSATSSSNGVYTVMEYCLNGDYTTTIPPVPPDVDPTISITIPAPLPGAGTYTSYDDAFTIGLLPAANAAIANIVAANGNLVTQANDTYTAMAEQLSMEKENQSAAQINFSELAANSKTSTMGLVSNLHELGQDVAPGGAAEFLELTANLSSLPGQAVVSSMREGRNITLLQNIGIALDTQIPPVSTTAIRANLLPSQDTVNDAINKLNP